MRNAPIAVFDSGMGGLTVLDRLQKKFPHESFVYLGDTARLPYGTKSPETVARYAAHMAGVLMEHRPKAMVIACNTASAVGLDAVRDVVGDISVIGMIDPASAQAAHTTQNKHITILGTHGTVRSGAYTRAIVAIDPEVTVQSLPCPLLVPLAEEGWIDHQATHDILETYLAPFFARGVVSDTVILGCTHFPVFLPILQKMLPQVNFIHCGDAAAEAMANAGVVLNTGNKGEMKIFLTDPVPQFDKYLGTFLNAGVAPTVQFVDVLPMAA